MRNNNFFYSNVLNSVVFYCELVEKVKFLWIKQFCIQAMSKEFLDLFFLWGGGGGRACAEANILFQCIKNFIRHFALFNFSRLSLAFILKYYPI